MSIINCFVKWKTKRRLVASTELYSRELANEQHFPAVMGGQHCSKFSNISGNISVWPGNTSVLPSSNMTRAATTGRCIVGDVSPRAKIWKHCSAILLVCAHPELSVVKFLTRNDLCNKILLWKIFTLRSFIPEKSTVFVFLSCQHIINLLFHYGYCDRGGLTH